MRTKEQQTERVEENIMRHQIKSVLRNSRDTLFQDAVGGVALVVMMVMALHVPGFI